MRHGVEVEALIDRCKVIIDAAAEDPRCIGAGSQPAAEGCRQDVDGVALRGIEVEDVIQSFGWRIVAEVIGAGVAEQDVVPCPANERVGSAGAPNQDLAGACAVELTFTSLQAVDGDVPTVRQVRTAKILYGVVERATV